MCVMISVVVCTYNRCDLFEQVMQTLINQTCQKKLYEIIIVDNNSKDETPNVADQLIKNNSETNMRYILETKQGLSHARNRGWKEARGKYVAYIDDDCKAPEQWLEVANQIIDQHVPALFGGPYYAFYNSPKPRWFKDSYESNTFGDEAHPISNKEFLTGANFFVLRSLLERIGGFDPNLGMIGNRVAYGEETALQKCIMETMPNELIYCDPTLYVYHLVRPEKMSLKWRIHMLFATGRDSYLIFQAKKGENLKLTKIFKQILRLMVYMFLEICKGTARDRNLYPYFENYLYEHVLLRIFVLGSLYEQLNQKVQK